MYVVRSSRPELRPWRTKVRGFSIAKGFYIVPTYQTTKKSDPHQLRYNSIGIDFD
jgi:hypothetical protein